jgi:hypothetical protein
MNSDGWRGYKSLVDLGYKKHFRVHHGRDQFVRGVKTSAASSPIGPFLRQG